MRKYHVFALSLLTCLSLFLANRYFRSDGASIAAPRQVSKPIEPSELSVPEDRLDFGTVWATNDFVWNLPITNQGSEPLEITDFLQSCTCTSVRPTQLAIPPGATETVKVHVDLVTKYRDQTAFQITAKTRDPRGEVKAQQPWTISGRVNRLLTLDRPLQFQTRSVLEQPLKPVECTATFATPIDSLEVESDDRRFAVNAERIDGSDRFRIRLSSTRKLECGTLDQIVTLTPKKGGHDLPASKIRCTGAIERDIEPIPPPLLGGPRKVGETWNERLACLSRTGRSARILSIRSDSPNIVGEAEGTSATIRVSIREPGQQTAKVFVRVEGEDGTYELPVDVYWLGQ